MSAVRELWASVVDWRVCGDLWGHIVAWWQVVTGRVKAGDRVAPVGDPGGDPVACELSRMSVSGLYAFGVVLSLCELLSEFGPDDLRAMRKVIDLELHSRDRG